MFKGIVFDFDGVVVDSHAVHVLAWKKFLASVGKSASEEQLQFILDGRKREDILRHFLGELDVTELAAYGSRKEKIFRTEAASIGTIQGVLEFLEDVNRAQLTLAIASSGSRSRVDLLLRQLDLGRHFQVIVTGDEVERGKPDPAVFLKAAQDLRIIPTELVAFEDALSGVKAAKAAGMKCVAIAESDRASVLLNAGADHVLPNFRGLSYAKLRQLFVR